MEEEDKKMEDVAVCERYGRGEREVEKKVQKVQKRKKEVEGAGKQMVMTQLPEIVS